MGCFLFVVEQLVALARKRLAAAKLGRSMAVDIHHLRNKAHPVAITTIFLNLQARGSAPSPTSHRVANGGTLNNDP